ncbi:acyl-CoA Delta(11) desaturase isoform X1 [Amyelois transitella]|uniref:acyl-CoA Delta(11) desaturase isoform X1 n=1 Tax=Amyelois transitella TaxID=680683 RepID=UPI00067D214F|nr:acyl-CoA Delta(11) desaturase isoform X1 [Amyelois transitella]XP_060803992.1 acyl-CoA Delta(11) desaturase isoform X1 [Amyelois transitella]
MKTHIEENAQYQNEKEEQKPEKLVAPQAGPWKFKIIYHVVVVLLVSHLFGFYGGYLLVKKAKIQTIIFTVFLTSISMLGITAGAHRLWSHRAYKAKTPLQILLAIFFLLTSQRSIVTWVENHRLHHRFSDTDGDPHNATRGFFFSTIGWTAVEPHPIVVREKKLIDMTDLLQNPIIRFQHKYIEIILIVVAYVIPTYIPTLWGESLYNAYFINFFRLVVVLTIAGLINSVAHIWGYKPIDKTVVGTQFLAVGVLAFGEGFHNYHHVFPYDYRTSEVGDTKYNFTALFIDLMAKIGWAYDLKAVPEETVRSRVLRKGDGSDKYYL